MRLEGTMNHHKSHVLLVDDNQEAVDLVSDWLHGHDIDTNVAYDGASALALLSAWPADMVFMDIQMPGMNGFDTAVAMHALPGYAALPIVAWTAWDSPGSRDGMARAEMVYRLMKPYALKDILRLISRYAPTH